MMVRSSSVLLAQPKQSCTAEMAKNCTRRVFVLPIPFELTWTRRATYIKGDPYIRDMKHTRSIIHIHHFTSFLGVFANCCQLPSTAATSVN
jgi:hypothetical protein